MLAVVRASGTSAAMETTLPFRESSSRNSGRTPGAPPENLCCAACAQHSGSDGHRPCAATEMCETVKLD